MPVSCMLVECMFCEFGWTKQNKCLCRYRDVLKEAHQHEIKKCDVVLCTCASALKPEIREVMDFRQILIDECAMATEPEAFIPLVSYNPQQVSSGMTASSSSSSVSVFKQNKRHYRFQQVEETCNLQQIVSNSIQNCPVP